MFYKKILELCKNKGISPSKLMTDLSMSKANIDRWQNGSIPQNSTIKKIADYFNVSTDYLLNGELAITEEIKQSNQQPLFTAEDVELLLKIKNLSSTERKEVESFVQFKELKESKKKTATTIAT